MTPSSLRHFAAPRARGSLRLLVIVSACLAALLATLHAPAASAAEDDPPSPAEVASFRIASFNVLGHGHTEPGGKRRGWARGPQRMNWTVKLIQANKLDVVGLQEFQTPQLERFQELVGRQFGVYPARRLGNAPMHNSIVYRKNVWRLLDARSIPIPYFKGNRIRMPYIWLEHRKTGRRIWVFNTHNPANAHGPAQKWRNMGFRMEAELINQLRTDYPNSAVFSTGDKNNRSEYYCQLSRTTEQHATNPGALGGNGQCTMPRPSYVDWVMGSSDTWFSNATALRTSLVKKASDHPLIMATARLAPAKPMPVLERVVVVGVQGLTRRSLRELGSAGAPNLQAMRREGVSTLDARTEYEATEARPNLMGMLTGRRVNPAAAGHGVTPRMTTQGTVAQSAGRYVSSVFDIAHNFSLRTEMLTSDRLSAMVQSSWNAANGGSDPYGRDDGRNKIDRFRLHSNDGQTVPDLLRSLNRNPANLTVAELTRPARAGRRSGYTSDAYLNAVRRVDADLGQLRAKIAGDPRLASSTVLIVTGLHGGSGDSNSDPAKAGNYRVPMLITGHGVPAGTSLYAANPTLRNPRGARPGYGATPPAWVMTVPSVINQALGLPPVPGAQIAYQVPTTVFSTFR